MASQAARATIRQVKPILSVDRDEARRRVLNLYKAWYRELPHIVLKYDINRTLPQCRTKLREEFMKNQHLTDFRLIDLLVIKGQMELKETVNIWKQKGHIMAYFKDSWEQKPTDFLSKFFTGHE